MYEPVPLGHFMSLVTAQELSEIQYLAIAVTVRFYGAIYLATQKAIQGMFGLTELILLGIIPVPEEIEDSIVSLDPDPKETEMTMFGSDDTMGLLKLRTLRGGNDILPWDVRSTYLSTREDLQKLTAARIVLRVGIRAAYLEE